MLLPNIYMKGKHSDISQSGVKSVKIPYEKILTLTFRLINLFNLSIIFFWLPHLNYRLDRWCCGWSIISALLNKSNFCWVEGSDHTSSRQRRPFRGKAKVQNHQLVHLQQSSHQPWLPHFLAGWWSYSGLVWVGNAFITGKTSALFWSRHHHRSGH